MMMVSRPNLKCCVLKPRQLDFWLAMTLTGGRGDGK
jgi:hypothetical protein